MGAALAEVGVDLTWEDGQWYVDYDVDPKIIHKASNLISPLLDESPLSYDEWARVMLAAAETPWERKKRAAWLSGSPYPASINAAP